MGPEDDPASYLGPFITFQGRLLVKTSGRFARTLVEQRRLKVRCVQFGNRNVVILTLINVKYQSYVFIHFGFVIVNSCLHVSSTCPS